MRRLLALVKGLPPEGALHRAVRGTAAGWTNTEELLAFLCELTDQTNRLLFGAFSKKGAKAPKPVSIPRPGQENQRRRRPKASAEELSAFLASPSSRS